MPNPNPRRTNGFKKGQSGNPRGSSASTRQLASIKKLTAEQLHEVFSILLAGDTHDIIRLYNDAKAPVLQTWLAKLVVKSMNRGDANTFRVLMDRVLGKPKEQHEHTGGGGGPIQVQTVEQIDARLATIRAEYEELGND